MTDPVTAWVAQALASFEKELTEGEGVEFRLPGIQGPKLEPDDIEKIRALENKLHLPFVIERNVRFSFTVDDPPRPYAYVPFDVLSDALVPHFVAI